MYSVAAITFIDRDLADTIIHYISADGFWLRRNLYTQEQQQPQYGSALYLFSLFSLFLFFPSCSLSGKAPGFSFPSTVRRQSFSPTRKKKKKNPTADPLSCGISSDLLSLYIYIPSGQSKRPGTCRANDPLVDVSSIDHMPFMSKNETKTSQSRVSLYMVFT